MKIDKVIVSSNICGHYLELYPLVYRIWKDKFNLDCYLILISDSIPENLNYLKEYIILFNPIENINSIFTAQFIRILYPALLEGNILISDIDIFPISENYFINSIKDFQESKFITYTSRYKSQNMYAICYNVANSKIWKQISNIKSLDDIRERIKLTYNINYTGQKNCDGWFLDQQELYRYVNKWNKISNDLIILEDQKLNFKRLDKRVKKEIVKNIDFYCKNINNYTDFHCIKPYSKLSYYIKKIVNEIKE